MTFTRRGNSRTCNGCMLMGKGAASFLIALHRLQIEHLCQLSGNCLAVAHFLGEFFVGNMPGQEAWLWWPNRWFSFNRTEFERRNVASGLWVPRITRKTRGTLCRPSSLPFIGSVGS